jgi:8-oxo-dGTP diphosphatase
MTPGTSDSEEGHAAVTPQRRQRIAAYALLLRGDHAEPEVLLTRMSSRTRIQGRWTLPGGGIEHGEDPREAVVREVYEETGLHIAPGPVADVHSSHFTGPRADGVVEDYHGVHVIFRSRLLPESEGVTPRVVEVDGSTEEVAWHRHDTALGLDLLSAARHALTVLTNED